MRTRQVPMTTADLEGQMAAASVASAQFHYALAQMPNDQTKLLAVTCPLVL